MSRYFVQRAQPVKADGYDYPVGNSWFIPCVPDHEATDTGILDASGHPIMRAPRPIGFGRDDEW